MPRTAYTALVVLLLRPAGAADAQRMQQLQRIRHTYDAAYTRWLPHITLVPPFAVPPPDADAGEDAEPAIRRAAAGRNGGVSLHGSSSPRGRPVAGRPATGSDHTFG